MVLYQWHTLYNVYRCSEGCTRRREMARYVQYGHHGKEEARKYSSVSRLIILSSVVHCYTASPKALHKARVSLKVYL